MYEVEQIYCYNVCKMIYISKMLNQCGKDMAQKFGLHHWDNAWCKTFAIVVLGIIKNKVYLVSNDHFPVATFQIKVVKDSLWFEKLAVLPQFNGEGVGTFCMDAIEKFARELKCSKVCMEVYEKSRHAIDFYSHKGYVAAGTVETMRYNELVMEKEIN